MDDRELIKSAITDLASHFVFYDRQEDDELTVERMGRILKEGVVSFDEIHAWFKDALYESFLEWPG